MEVRLAILYSGLRNTTSGIELTNLFLPGSEGQYKHQLRGYLAGLSLLLGSTEHSEVLKCLHQCAESLQVPATSQIRPGMEMVTDTQQSRVIVDGDNAENMVALVRQV